MVQAKYIRRGNKLHGPYYYETYRDEDGRVRKRYLGKSLEERSKFSNWKVFFVILLVGVLAFGFYFEARGAAHDSLVNMLVREAVSFFGVDVSNENRVMLAPSASISASRISCAAPCAVFFDATGTTGLTDNDYANAYFSWNFGDSNSGTWTKGRKNSDGTYPSKNVDTGFIAAHLYENAGSYETNLIVRDKDGTNSNPVTVTVRVVDEESVFGGANTYCFSNDLDFRGCPHDTNNDGVCDVQSGNCVGNTNSFSTALGYLGQNRRLLFKMDDEFFIPSSGTTISGAGPMMLDSFSVGARRPHLRFQNQLGLDRTAIQITGSDVRVMNLEMTPETYDYQLSALVAARGQDNLIYGMKLNPGVRINIDLLQKSFIIDSEMTPGWYDIVGQASESAIMGSSWQHSRFGDDLTNHIRNGKTLFAHNSMAVENNYCIRHYAGELLVTDNIINCDRTLVTAECHECQWNDPPSPSCAEQVCPSESRVNVFEKNEFLYPTGAAASGAFIDIASKYIGVIRNNIFYNSEYGATISTNYIDQGSNPTVGDFGVGSDNLYIYDNTNYKPNSEGGFIVANDINNLEVKNNIHYGPGAFITYLNVDSYSTTNNLEGSVDPLFVSTNSVSNDFMKLMSNSPAVDTGASVPVFDDFYGDLRMDGQMDLGACELQDSSGSACVVDGFCDIAGGETSESCSTDCTGRHFVIDGNNENCTIYVGESGAGNLTKPFCKFDSNVEMNILPGDTYYFRGGIQNISYLPMTHGGSPGSYVTIRNFPGERPILESGVLFQTTWTLNKTGSNYRIFKSSTNFGTDPATQPYDIMFDLQNPLSRIFYYENLSNVLFIPTTNVSFDARYIDCSTGELYVRFSNISFDPNAVKTYLNKADRIVLTADYVKFIGLTFQHGTEGVKINNNLYPALQTNHVEFYDNTFRSLRSGIGDILESSPPDDFLIIQNNTFLNIAPNVMIRVSNSTFGDGRLVRCASELEDFKSKNDSSFYWWYTADTLDRALYGAGTGTIFSGNYVDMGGSPLALYVSANSKFFNNYIKGGIEGGSWYGYSQFYNNIVITPYAPVLGMQAAHVNTTVMNNLFIVNSGFGDQFDLSFGSGDGTFQPFIRFKNNIIIDLHADNSRYCVFYYQSNKDNSLMDLNNNVYVGCGSWSAFNQSGRYYFNSGNPSGNLDGLKQFWGAGRESNSFLSSLNGLFVDFAGGDYQLDSASPAIDAGMCDPLTSTDILGNSRPMGSGCDIGPFESLSGSQTCNNNGVCEKEENETNCPADCASSGSGLVLHLDFNGNMNDCSGKGNNGTCSGASCPILTTDKEGNANSAYSFDGGDHVDCGSDASLNLNNDFTLAAWIKPNSLPEDQSIVMKGIHTEGPYDPRQYELGLRYDEARFVTYVSGWNSRNTSVANLQLNTWQHVVYVKNGSNGRFYVDGVAMDSNSIPASLPANMYSLYVGGIYDFGTNEGFNGDIDDVRVYNRALSQTEVLNIFNGRGGGSYNAGFRIDTFSYVNSSGGVKSLDVGIWYPSSDVASLYQYSGTSGSKLGIVAFNGTISDSEVFPLVIFSHGYGGCGLQSLFFTEELARRGFIVVAPDHNDAGCSVNGSGEGETGNAPGFSTPELWNESYFLDRKEDVSAVIDYILASQDFADKVDSNKIGIAGHSLGGYTAAGVTGGWQSWKDGRIKAALLLSPYIRPYSINSNLSKINIPLMYQGGTRDSGITPFLQSAYDKANSPKFFLNITGARHFAWTNTACLGFDNINECLYKDETVQAINNYGIAFFERYLDDNLTAEAQLTTAALILDSYQYEMPSCGNGLCELGENFVSCAADCEVLCNTEADLIPCDGCVNQDEIYVYIASFVRDEIGMNELTDAINSYLLGTGCH